MADTSKYHCTRCHDERQHRGVRWPEGFVCRRCYQQATRRRGTCPSCQRPDRLLPGLDDTQAICTDCAGIDDPRLTCTRCGDQDEPHRRGLCARCCLTDDLTALLTTADTGHISTELQPLLDALTSQDHPRSALIWLRNPDVRQLLDGFAQHRLTISHDTFAHYPADRTARHLRDLFISCGILAPYDRNLDRFTSWLEKKLASTPIHQSQQVITGFATWHHLRKLRARSQRQPLENGPIANAKQEITAAIDFTNWLYTRNTPLAQATQSDIDAWLATGPTTRSIARMFVRWCITHQHITAHLEFPYRRARTHPMTSDDERYARLTTILGHRDTPVWVKAATVLLLICAQPVSRIAAIKLDALRTDDSGSLWIRFADAEVELPPPLADPVTELIAQRPNMNTAANQTSQWLFPGVTAGHHINPQTLMGKLRANGIDLQGARNSAMRELVRAIPPAIAATQFGYRAQTTERHAFISGTNWSAYPELRQEPDTTEPGT